MQKPALSCRIVDSEDRPSLSRAVAQALGAPADSRLRMYAGLCTRADIVYMTFAAHSIYANITGSFSFEEISFRPVGTIEARNRSSAPIRLGAGKNGPFQVCKPCWLEFCLWSLLRTVVVRRRFKILVFTCVHDKLNTRIYVPIMLVALVYSGKASNIWDISFRI